MSGMPSTGLNWIAYTAYEAENKKCEEWMYGGSDPAVEAPKKPKTLPVPAVTRIRAI